MGEHQINIERFCTQVRLRDDCLPKRIKECLVKIEGNCAHAAYPCSRPGLIQYTSFDFLPARVVLTSARLLNGSQPAPAFSQTITCPDLVLHHSASSL